MELKITKIDEAIVFVVKVVPASSRTTVAGTLDGMLKVKVASPPEKGKANKCLIEFLAKQIGVKKKSVSIISGKTNPVKGVQVLGVSPQVFSQKLGLDQRGLLQ